MAAGNWVDWNTGDLVTAASFQDIQDSIVFIYADDSAANTALTNKVEGTTYFDTTLNKLKVWDGSAWVEVGGAGAAFSVYDNWAMTADLTAPATPITANLARFSTGITTNIGDAMTVSSGVFTFPSTGIYQVTAQASARQMTNSVNAQIYIRTTNDNFASNDDAVAYAIFNGPSTNIQKTLRTQALIDVTDTSTHKVKFQWSGFSSGQFTLYGSSTQFRTGFHFIKIADT